jgi:hypothetical protein
VMLVNWASEYFHQLLFHFTSLIHRITECPVIKICQSQNARSDCRKLKNWQSL